MVHSAIMRPCLLRRVFLGASLVLVAGMAMGVHACEVRITIVDAHERPLAGIQVRLEGSRDDASGPRYTLAEGTTDILGGFLAESVDGPVLMLALTGPQGVGRVRWDGASTAGSVVYPVQTTIVLLHDNDLHFNFNHRRAFSAAVDQVRRTHKNVFLLNAGDVFIRRPERWNEPTTEFYTRHSRNMIETMNELGYDAMTLGNHELDYVDGLTHDALARARFPLLAANIDVSTDLLPRPLPYTVLVTDNDLTIAVLGLSLINSREDGVAMRDANTVARQYLHLAQEHDVFVALTHLGHRGDQELAQAMDAIDVIIGGHSHTLLSQAEMVNTVLVAQAGGTGADRPNSVDPQRPKYLGLITLTLENDAIVAKQGEVRSFTSDIPADQTLPTLGVDRE